MRMHMWVCIYICACFCIECCVRFGCFCSQCCRHFGTGILGTSACAGVYITQVSFLTSTYTSANTLASGCAHMCICIYMLMCMHVYTYVCLQYCLTRWGVVAAIFNLCISVHMHAYVYVCACIRVHVQVYIYVYVYMCLCICMHIHVYTHACGCKYALV